MGIKPKLHFGNLKIEVRAVEGLILPLRTRPILRNTAGRVLQLENQTNCELDVLLTTDLQMQKLNKKYLSRNKTTDVLAFPQEEAKFLGDIVISVETAMRQAQDEGHDLLTELQYLLIHGILHLLDYNDRTVTKRKQMRARERQILNKLELNAHPVKD